MAQAVYYVTAALALGAPWRRVAFAVPTGNFGDVYAGYVAQRMGLPIAQLIVATNRNDILARFFETGVYRAGAVVPTTSPSMDIQVASNFERLLFDLCGRDGGAVAGLMAEFQAQKRLSVGADALGRARELFDAARVEEEEVSETMADVLRTTGTLIDPHTAVGVAAGRRCRQSPEHPAGRARDRPSGQVPGRGARGDRDHAGAAGPPRRSRAARGALHPAAERSRRGTTPDRAAGPGVRMTDNTRITTLENGLRVASETMANVQTASVGVWVDVGARYEAEEVNGVAHMLEHMAFKGTARRSARAIAEAIENVGGQLNAYTSREHTAYYARILADDVPLAVDLLADILQHSAFDETELARERGVVLQEIGQVQDTPDDLVFDLFQETAFPGQPIGRSILGPAELIAALPRVALVDYMAGHYGPTRMVLAAAGKVEHEQLVELGERLVP